MTRSSATTEHHKRLMKIAQKSRVQVHFIPAQQFPGLEWDGLYLVAPELGAGIAIREDLEDEWRDWILAHELGHHFSKLDGTLFSPFCAHKVDAASRMHWSGPKQSNPDENRANEWAATTLVSLSEWELAEAPSPCDLRQVVARLGLPTPAAVAWERWQRSSALSKQAVIVRFDCDEWRIIGRPVNGQGGHQSFFRRLLRRRDGQSLIISFTDFSLARERVLWVQGGWLERYRTLLRAVDPLIADAGGVRSLFNYCLSKVGRIYPGGLTLSLT